ncbi:MAG: polysaccharide biosynthesis protein [Bacteroidetes bacterium]|nr:polysaccharide biosynthesis protein [Bacteroidota bacterium]
MSLFLYKSRTPRWIVIVADLVIAAASLFCAYILRFDMTADIETVMREWNQLSKSIWIFFAVKFAVFYFLKIHEGLLRYTSTEDIKRIFFALFISSSLFGAGGYIRYNFDDELYLFPTSVLIMEFMTSFLFLVGSRFFIKLTYIESIKNLENKISVVIYGAGVSGLITKKTIEQDTKNNEVVVAFIDDNKKLVGNRIEGIKVYSLEELPTLINNYQVKHCIIAIQDIRADRQREIANSCLDLGVTVKKVPNAKSWTNGTFSVKQITQINIEELLGREVIKLNFEKIQDDLGGKTILVSGSAGSIGAGLCREIASFEPKLLVLLDQAESPLYDIECALREDHSALNYEIVIGDICNEVRMQKLFDMFKFDVIFHAAAYKHVPIMELNPAEAVLNNVLGTKILADLAKKNEVNKFVLISTDKAVNPTNVMGASKRIAEIYTQFLNGSGKTKFITTRFGNVLGSNGSVIPLFEKQIKNGGPITITDKRITRFFMTISEACQLVLEAGTMGNGGEIFIFEMGDPVRILDLAKKMIALSNLEIGKDIDICFIGLRPGEKLYEEVLAIDENTLPTHHQKILILKTREVNQTTIELINQLILLIDSQKNNDIVALMKKIVPEYISKNSEYEKLDTC